MLQWKLKYCERLKKWQTRVSKVTYRTNLLVLIQPKFSVVLSNCSSFFLLSLYLPKLNSLVRGKDHIKSLPVPTGTNILFGLLTSLYFLLFSKIWKFFSTKFKRQVACLIVKIRSKRAVNLEGNLHLLARKLVKQEISKLFFAMELCPLQPWAARILVVVMASVPCCGAKWWEASSVLYGAGRLTNYLEKKV